MSFINKPIEQLNEELVNAWEDASSLGEEADKSPFHGRIRFEAGVLYEGEIIMRQDFGMEAMEPTHLEVLSIGDSAVRSLRLRSGARLEEIRIGEGSKRTIILVFSA